jgi:nitrite reductase/ring-hydroxylating ferredoxin subunit
MHLHLGKLTGDVLQCPFHSAKFGVETGAVVESHEPQIDKQLKKKRPNSLRPLIVEALIDNLFQAWFSTEWHLSNSAGDLP